VGEDCSRGAEHPRGGMAKLLRPDGGAGGTSPTFPRQPQAGDLGEEVGGGTSVGWGPDLEDEVPHAEEPKTRWRGGRQHQEARLEILPAEDRTRPHRTIPALG